MAGFTRRNILRCINGVEAPNGPDLALRNEEVWKGLHGLPDMFARRPELDDLLVRRRRRDRPGPRQECRDPRCAGLQRCTEHDVVDPWS